MISLINQHVHPAYVEHSTRFPRLAASIAAGAYPGQPDCICVVRSFEMASVLLANTDDNMLPTIGIPFPGAVKKKTMPADSDLNRSRGRMGRGESRRKHHGQCSPTSKDGTAQGRLHHVSWFAAWLDGIDASIRIRNRMTGRRSFSSSFFPLLEP